MKKVKVVLVLLLCLGISGCGIFKKGCGCPKFGMLKTGPAPVARC